MVSIGMSYCVSPFVLDEKTGLGSALTGREAPSGAVGFPWELHSFTSRSSSRCPSPVSAGPALTSSRGGGRGPDSEIDRVAPLCYEVIRSLVLGTKMSSFILNHF